MYLIITYASGYIEEKGVNKYLVFDSMELHSKDKNKELLKKYNNVFNGIRNKIKKIGGNECDYGFKYEPYLCNRCRDLMQKAMGFNNIAIEYIKENA